MSDFRTVARSLAPFIKDVWDLLDATDAVLSLTPAPVAGPDENSRVWTHEGRVVRALMTPSVVRALQEGKKINAIKELRAVTNCGLKEAKDAIEDPHVTAVYPYPVYQ